MNQKSSRLRQCPGLWAIAGWAGGTSRELRNSSRVRWCQERQLRNWQQAMFGSVLFSRQVWCVLFAIKRNYTVYCWFCWLGRECPHPWSWILVILPRKKECYLQIHRPLQSQFLVKEKKSPADLPVPRRTPTSGSQDPRQSTRLANYFKVWPHRITYCIIFWWLSSTHTHTLQFISTHQMLYHITVTLWAQKLAGASPACLLPVLRPQHTYPALAPASKTGL